MVEGETELSLGDQKADDYELLHDLNIPVKDEGRMPFPDSETAKAFQAETNYNNGLANVDDMEFEKRVASVNNGVRELIAAGEVQSGKVVRIKTVPNRFLRNAPLVEGRWVDQYVIELAEWGAKIETLGFHLQDAQDHHPLAWDDFGEGEIDHGKSHELDTLSAEIRNEAREHLSKFSGGRREIDSRPYLDFQDYTRWRGRWVKGNFRRMTDTGLLASSWNDWIEHHHDNVAHELQGLQLGALRRTSAGGRFDDELWTVLVLPLS